MPVAKRGERGGRQALVVAIAGTLGMVAIGFLIIRSGDLFPSSESGSLLGAGGEFTFEAEPIAATIADTGPVTFPDLAGRDRDLVVQHLGDDLSTGWSAFGSRPLSADRSCNAAWDPTERVFFDSCSDATWDEVGQANEPGTPDLPSYPVTVGEDGTVSVDVNAADRDAVGEPSSGEDGTETE